MQRHINVTGEGAASVVQNVVVKNNDPYGPSFFEKISLRPGLLMIIAHHVQHEGFKMGVEIDRAPVSFSYNLSHRVRCTVTHGAKRGTVLERASGDGVLAYLPKTRGIIEIPPGERINGVSVHFSVHSFRELFREEPQCIKKFVSGRDAASAEQHFYQQSRFNGETALIVKQIIGCPYQGEIRRLFFEAKSLELVALKLAELGQDDFRDVSDLSRKDLDRAREAYHILLTNLDQPPNLVDLSRLVGINRNKLNRGFKELYGDTVFNVLRNARLSKAWLLLKQTDRSLSEIALSVGYNNQANFTTAFRKQFGKTPKTVRREVIGDPFPPNAMSY
jgi:AraC-like DNA-binding protein